MKRFVSDIDRIMALIYEDQPLPPPVPKGAGSLPAPESAFRRTRASEERQRQALSGPLFRKECVPAKRPVRKAPAPPQLNLDLSSLAKIRSDAEITRERLLTDEEREEEVSLDEQTKASVYPEERKEAGPAASEVPLAPEPFAECGLSAVETELLLALLQGGNVAAVNTGGQLLSVLVDQINEKLFDEFADTVIENGASPAILSDYEEELKAMFL